MAIAIARSTSRSEARIVGVRSLTTSRLMACEIDAVQPRQDLAHALHRLDDVGAGLLLDDEHDRRLAVGHAVVAQILHGIDHLGHVAQPHRGAVAVAQPTTGAYSAAVRAWSLAPICQ